MSDLPADVVERTLGDWAQSAACRGVNPDVFHPVDEDYALALTYCARRPVRQECLTHALANNERDGMWGGLTGRARSRMRARAHMAPPPDDPRRRNPREIDPDEDA